ncbi:MAG: nicotinate (nicotinamide) nucleotide adenylyltransferase [Chlamydiales bacterium]|nr:nicotinate (nicotinamide) nucleotide adenylyltransferase [Chlamydiales bacterium]
MKESRQIGLFGGSFDPIHYGHLNLALQLKKLTSLELVLFIPAAVSPFKIDHPPKVSGQMRMEMCKLALEGQKGCEVCDIELKRGCPSFMIDTVKELAKLYPNARLRLILAEDALSRLHEWKDAETLVRLAPPLIGTRKPHCSFNFASHFSAEAIQLIEKGRLETNPSPVSSTEVRNNLAQGKLDLEKSVPKTVLKYIKDHHLYMRSQDAGKSPGNSKPRCADHL